MNRFLILWLLATSIITQGFGQGTPKPTVFTIVPKANVSGLNKTLDSLRQALLTIPSGGTANVSPSSVKPITDGLYPDLLKSANQYGATPGAQVDQSFYLNQAFATQSEVTFQPGIYYLSRFRVPDGKTLRIDPGVEFRGLALTPGQQSGYGNDHHGLFELGPGSKIVGSGSGVIDGRSGDRPGLLSHAVYFINADSAQVVGVTVRNAGGTGIRWQNSHAVLVSSNQVLNCGDKGIEFIVSDYARVFSNLVYMCEHGIQWWGTPGAGDFSDGFTITGNTVRRIRNGGIWGNAGKNGSVTGNFVEEVGDVLFDAEESYGIAFTGNTGHNGRNAGLAWFHGSQRITFTGNVILQDVGYGPAVKGYGPNISKDITVTGGSLITLDPGVPAIFTDALVLENFSVTSVKTIRSAGNGIETQTVNGLSITDCKIWAAGPLGIQNTGGVGGTIAGNRIEHTAADTSGTKGIWNVWVSPAFPAQYNTIRSNEVLNYGKGIHNDLGGDITGRNKIIDNTTNNVITPRGAGALSIIERNRNVAGQFVDGTVELTSAEKTKISSLGTMSSQSGNAVAITGGTADLTGLGVNSTNPVSIRSAGGNIALEMVGDGGGGTRMDLFNRAGQNGPLFTTTGGNDLIDFGFGTFSNKRGNIRYEGRVTDGADGLGTWSFSAGGNAASQPSLQIFGTKVVANKPLVVPKITFPDGSTMVTAPVATTGGSYSPSYYGSALIIVDFNSLGAGRGSSHEISNPDDYSPGPFPYTMMNTLASQFPGATFAKKNFSVSGRQTPTMIANSGQVDAQFNPALFDRQIIVAGEITNHIADGGATAQQAIDSYVSYCKARRAKGFLVVATTVFPRTSFFGSGMSPAEFEARRTVVNDYIKLHYLEFADQLADINTLAGVTFPDGTHLDNAGYVLMANLIAGKVSPLLLTGFNPASIAFLLSGTTTTPPSSTTTTPPTTGTVTAGTVLLIAGTGSDGSTNITDATGKTVSRVGNPVISTAQSQYGGSSIYLDGNSFLTIPTSSDFDFGTGDFTVELFARPTELQRQYGGLVARGDETDNQWTFSYNAGSANPDLFIRQNGGYGSGAIAGSSSGLTLNAWQHVALVRKSNVVKVYVNGVAVGSNSTTLSMETTSGSRRVNIGAFPTPNTAGSPEQEKFKGYLQGVRITKGTARYDGNFAPPTSY